MTTIFAKQALTPEGWRSNVRVEIDSGKVVSVQPHSTAQIEDTTVDTLLPSIPNLHSHTFQRAMAGMTERRGPGEDSFWTWRELMYRFLQHLTPEDVEAIATFAFMEMQEAGFASVAEFHYIHHAVGGIPYANRAELCERIIAASATTGIGLALVPVLYTYAGLNKKPLAENQLRFRNTLSQYEALHDGAASILAKTLPVDARIGFAPHSLRAVAPEDLFALAEMGGDAPTHLHIAEQVAEVEEVESATGQTPVAWLLDHVDVRTNWCLVHATHMTQSEVAGLVNTGAIAGLCPLTEANLGDGIFSAREFLSLNGRFGIGTDSNINISMSGELSALEYSQRLRHKKRSVLAQGDVSTGTNIYTRAAAGGAQALGRHCGAIEIGLWADLVAIDSNQVHLCGLTQDQLLDGWIFAANQNPATDLWSAGRHSVVGGRHINRDVIEKAYRYTLKRLSSL